MSSYDGLTEKLNARNKHDMEREEMYKNHEIAMSDMKHKHEMDKLATEYERELLEEELTAIDDLYDKCIDDKSEFSLESLRSFQQSKMDKKLEIFKKYGAPSKECRKRKADDSDEDC
jgi:methylase of polypeptide subunit release factors